MRTIPMEKIFPPVNDSSKLLASDTTQIDTTGIRNPNYVSMANNDQLIYDDLFGSYLVKKNKNKESKEKPGESKIKKDTVGSNEENEGRKKSIFNIFRKKEKNNTAEENTGKSKTATPAEKQPVQSPTVAPPNQQPENKKLNTPAPKKIPADSTKQDGGF